MREEERQLIKRLAAHDPAAGHEFAGKWDDRIKVWISQNAPRVPGIEHGYFDIVRIEVRGIAIRVFVLGDSQE